MHIVLFRYSARVVHLEHLCDNDVVVIAPEEQRAKYDLYQSEGYQLPRIIFLDDFTLPNIILEIEAISQETVIESITTLSEEDMDMAGFLHDHFVIKNTRALSNLLFKDKYFMRSFLVGKVEQPYFRLLESEEDALLFWQHSNSSKAIIKPRNSAGSVGIQKINRDEKIDARYFDKNYLIEEYVSIDKMITCDGYALGSDMKQFYVHEYEELLLNTLSSSGYYLIRTSALYEEGRDSLALAFEQCQKVLEVLSVEGELTPFHFEWFYDVSTKRLVFCEVGKRFGGGDIPQLIKDSYGVDILKEYWSILMGSSTVQTIDVSGSLAKPSKISATFALYRQEGKVLEIPDQKDLDWANKVYIFVKPNDVSKKAKTIVENAMLVQFVCDNQEIFEERLSNLKAISQDFKYEASAPEN